MSKSIAIIAYYFPPITGAGVQRVLRLVKELCRHDFRVTVITSDSYFMGIDSAMGFEIPENCKVVRFSDPLKCLYGKNWILKFLRHGVYSLFFPDMMYLWFRLNYNSILEILKKDIPNTLITTSGPESSHLFGLKIKRKWPEIKWIADFRDAYSKNPSKLLSKNMVRNNPIINSLHRGIESKITRYADFITTVSSPLLKYLTNSDGKGRVVPNGFDSQVFNCLPTLPKTTDYEIFYMGSLYYERDPMIFLGPLLLFLNDLSEQERQQVKFKIAGNSRQQEMALLERQLSEYGIMENLGFLNHKEALIVGMRAALLLLLIDDVPGSETVYTGKVFEYIRLPTPILAIVPPDGAAGLLVGETNTGSVIKPGKTKEIYSFLKRDFEDWKRDKERKVFNSRKRWEKINQYDEISIFKLWEKLL